MPSDLNPNDLFETTRRFSSVVLTTVKATCVAQGNICRICFMVDFPEAFKHGEQNDNSIHNGLF